MPRKQDENLKPFTSEQSREEAEKNGKKGGIASGKARRQKKALRETMEEMLKVALKDERLLETYGKFGFTKKGMTMQDAITAGIPGGCTETLYSLPALPYGFHNGLQIFRTDAKQTVFQ